MKLKTLKQKAFTLIELLVVIAIIGILATVIAVSVHGSKTKAEEAKIASDIAQAVKSASICVAQEGTIQNQVFAGNQICSIPEAVNNAVWPDVPDGWAYKSNVVPSNNTFKSSIDNTDTNRTIVFDQNGVTLAADIPAPDPKVDCKPSPGSQVTARPGTIVYLNVGCTKPIESVTWSPNYISVGCTNRQNCTLSIPSNPANYTPFTATASVVMNGKTEIFSWRIAP